MGDLVSIIVPVYNVELYLDECISSLVNQTYTNLEIILINDGSTDGSLKKCEEWADKDKRIHVYSKNNEGLGPTRNFGVKKATGEWIAFIDSDDWYEKTFVEKLYVAIHNENANMARCNFREVDMDGRLMKVTNSFESLGVERTDHVIFPELALGLWTILVKRELFNQYFLEQPNCKTQDFAVGLAILLAAKRCAYVNETLHNYRKGRPGALSTGSKSKRYETAEKALPWLVSILKKNNLYEENVHVIKRYVQFSMSIILYGGWMNMGAQEYNVLKDLYCDSISREIDYNHKEIAVLGSWNITEAMRKLPYLQDMDYAIHFSSLISVMSKYTDDIKVFHNSLYRNKMIQRDITSAVWDIFDKKKPDWFVFDLLEERHHVLKIGNSFITESDAFKECGGRLDNAEIVECGSEEWLTLWRRSCDAFMLKLQNYMSLDNVIMVRNYLAEAYGNVHVQNVYDEIRAIKCANELIGNCYNYIEEHYPDIKVVDVSNDKNYITDVKYEYGTYPWYLNTMINEKVAGEIEKILN